jgi:hypothetical protein
MTDKPNEVSTWELYETTLVRTSLRPRNAFGSLPTGDYFHNTWAVVRQRMKKIVMAFHDTSPIGALVKDTGLSIPIGK